MQVDQKRFQMWASTMTSPGLLSLSAYLLPHVFIPSLFCWGERASEIYQTCLKFMKEFLLTKFGGNRAH